MALGWNRTQATLWGASGLTAAPFLLPLFPTETQIQIDELVVYYTHKRIFFSSFLIAVVRGVPVLVT